MSDFIKKNGSSILIIIGGLVMFTVIYFWRSREADYGRKLSEMNQRVHNSQVVVNDFAIVQQYNQILSTDSLRSQILVDVNGNERSIAEVLNERNIVFFFQKDMCKACVDKELQNLKAVIQSEGTENLIVLMKDYNINYLKLSEDLEEFRDRVFQIREDAYNIGDLSHTPSLAIVDHTGRVITANHAIKSTNLNFELFHEIIKDSYAKPAAH